MILLNLIIAGMMTIRLNHEHDMFHGLSDEELKKYLGLHQEFYKDTLLTMFQSRLGTV